MMENNKIIGQKWIVRKKESSGKFKHVATFDFEPFQKDLQKFGNGEYSVMTTKPSFKFYKKVIIEEIKKEDKMPSQPKVNSQQINEVNPKRYEEERENCFDHNKYDKECKECNAEELCEDEEITITCEECGCEFTISEDEVDDIICPKCETELEIEE